MRTAIRAFAVGLFLLAANAAIAAERWVAMPPPLGLGNDANTCETANAPCATIPAAIAKSPRTESVTVKFVGPYSHPAHIDVSFRTFGVTIWGGPFGCGEPEAAAVVLGGGITAQDYTNLNLQCLTVAGHNGLHCRQFAICDYVNVRLAATSTQLSAVDKSVINCGGSVWIRGGGSTFIAVGNSIANMGCWFGLPAGLSFADTFVSGTGFSVINTTGMAIAAHPIGPAKKWILTNSVLYKPAAYQLPGVGSVEIASTVY